MGAGSFVQPRLVGIGILTLLLLALLGGCAASGETTGDEQTSYCPQTTGGGEITGGEQTSYCTQANGGSKTTGGDQIGGCPQTSGGRETTGGEQTSGCRHAADGSQAADGTEKAACPTVTRRGSDLLRPSFVGEIYGTSAFIGIAFPGNTIPSEGPDEGMEVIVFITDGDPEQMGLRGAYGEWFRGTINEEGAIDSLESDLGVEIWGPVTERTSTGAIRFEEDAVFPYRADLVTGNNDAGLYRQEGEVEGIGYTAGWIVLPDGRVRGSSFPPYIPCCGPEECLPQTGGGK
jgi:hypothetical protein